jgi:thiol-disulfide isomerase/thioredoxin
MNRRPTKQVLVGKIYADWCGHCQSLKPEWAKMKRFVKMNMGRMLKNVRVEFVEIEQQQEEAKLKQLNGREEMQKGGKKVGVQGGYPTLFKVCDGMIEYYNGPRVAEAMYKWYMQGCGESGKGVAAPLGKQREQNKLPWRGGKTGKRGRRVQSGRHTRKQRPWSLSLF